MIACYLERMTTCCITTTNGTFSVGDCVLINHEGAIVNDQPWMTVILSFSHNKKKAMVRWFYRSEDALEKHPPFFGNDELIWSNHRDTVSIDNILGKCNVHTLDEYCTCRMPYNPDNLIVWCEACKQWYHAECEGMTSYEVERIKP
ncbi:hypothetical protein ACFX2H_006170 [Malus domestica]